MLEPHLELYSDGIDLSFKIGITQMYILKDIFNFAENLDESKEYAYGKKLAFIHTEDAFTEESKKLVKFVRHWVKNHNDNSQNAAYRYRYGYNYCKTAGKET